MSGRHRSGEPRLDVWLERLWLLGTTTGLALLAALAVQHGADHALAAPVSAPDTDTAL
ncbi:hypothetical protein ACIGW8_29610 [Streptomyces sioyaensis]|uniref:hypothetical protein n=1 Tax=Streptomyces sioyaensis TaxID=67364 RepID=UPI0037CD7B52